MNNNDNDNDNYNDLEDNNQYQDIFHDTDMIIPKNGYSLKSAVSFIGGKKKTNNNDKNDKNDNFSKKNDKFSNSISEELNLDHLAIPPSLYYMEYTVRPTYQNYSNTCGDDNNDNNDNDDNDKMISDSVYDKLLLLAEDSSRKQKKYTKRNKKIVKNDKKDKNKNRKTRHKSRNMGIPRHVPC